MATRYAVATGNWSSTATWDGGTLPTSADDVYANNRTVTIDQNVTVLSLRTTATTGVSAGGLFNIPSGSSFNVTAINGFTAGSSSVLQILGSGTRILTGSVFGSSTTGSTQTIYIQHVSGNIPIVTINGSVTGGTQSSARGVYIWGGEVVVNGSSTGGTASNTDGVYAFNSDNQPTRLTINTGPISGGTSSGCGSCINYSPTGSALTNSYTQLNGNILAGFSSTSSYGHLHNSTIPLTIVGSVSGGLANGASGLYINVSNTVNVTGAVQGNVGYAIYQNSSGILTVNGNVTGGVGASGIFHANNSATTNVNGNITGGDASNSWGLWVNANGTVNITGNIYGGTNGSEPYGLYSVGNATITVTGNVYGGTSGGSTAGGIRIGGGLTSGGTLIVNGDVFGSDVNRAGSAYGILLWSNGTVTINGTVTAGAGSGCHGVYNQNSGTVYARKAVGNAFGRSSITTNPIVYALYGVAQTSVLQVSEIEVGANGAWPIFGPVLFLDTSTNRISLRTYSGSAKNIVSSNYPNLTPSTSNVRSGVVYNSSSSTGTMAVPAASSVAAGVAVGNTVGTAVLTQANVWDYALSSASSVAGSVGEKLKKTAIPADIIALG